MNILEALANYQVQLEQRHVVIRRRWDAILEEEFNFEDFAEKIKEACGDDENNEFDGDNENDEQDTGNLIEKEKVLNELRLVENAINFISSVHEFYSASDSHALRANLKNRLSAVMKLVPNPILAKCLETDMPA